MKKCPKCKTVYGMNKGKPSAYVYCPMCGEELVAVQPRRVYLSRIEWEEFNKIEHAVPWNTEIRVKGLEDEPF